MSLHNDGDGLSDEKEEDLKSLLTEDNITQDLELEFVVGGGVNLI